MVQGTIEAFKPAAAPQAPHASSASHFPYRPFELLTRFDTDHRCNAPSSAGFNISSAASLDVGCGEAIRDSENRLQLLLPD
jgi:hypothetical protein